MKYSRVEQSSALTPNKMHCANFIIVAAFGISCVRKKLFQNNENCEEGYRRNVFTGCTMIRTEDGVSFLVAA